MTFFSHRTPEFWILMSQEAEKKFQQLWWKLCVNGLVVTCYTFPIKACPDVLLLIYTITVTYTHEWKNSSSYKVKFRLKGLHLYIFFALQNFYIFTLCHFQATAWTVSALEYWLTSNQSALNFSTSQTLKYQEKYTLVTIKSYEIAFFYKNNSCISRLHYFSSEAWNISSSELFLYHKHDVPAFLCSRKGSSISHTSVKSVVCDFFCEVLPYYDKREVLKFTGNWTLAHIIWWMLMGEKNISLWISPSVSLPWVQRRF